MDEFGFRTFSRLAPRRGLASSMSLLSIAWSRPWSCCWTLRMAISMLWEGEAPAEPFLVPSHWRGGSPGGSPCAGWPTDPGRAGLPVIGYIRRIPGYWRLPDHVVHLADAQVGHDLRELSSATKKNIVDHVLGLAGELLAQLRVLRGDAHRAGVQMAHPHHQAAGGDQRRRWRSRSPQRPAGRRWHSPGRS